MSSSSDECASESDAIIRSVMSESVKFLLVVILLNALVSNLAQPKPNTFWLIVIQASALPGQLHVIGLTWNRLNCAVEDRHKHEPTFQKGWEEIVKENE